jgi:uncharacterized membrane protein SpoIIM required for sporulation
MSREIFEERHDPDWRRLDEQLRQLESSKPGAAAENFPLLYRRVCHHLALARHRLYGHDLERRLNALVQRSHEVLYGPLQPRAGQVYELLTGEFPRALRRDAKVFLFAMLLFFGSWSVLFVIVQADPDLAYTVIDPLTADSYREMYQPAEPQAKAEERGFETDTLAFGNYIHNNISIAFRTFAAGVFAGIGAIFILLYNGVVLGAVAGFLVSEGLGPQLWPFVAGHSAPELVGLTIAGVAGLRLGLALIAPGRRKRGHALAEATREAYPILAGAFALVLLAAFIEAYWSASTLVPVPVKLVVGVLNWLLLFAFLIFGGRRRES